MHEPASTSYAAERSRFSDTEVAALKAHPRFAEACWQAAMSGLKLYRGNRFLNTIVNERGRSGIGFLALYLHNERRPDDPRSGLTLSRLKSICADQDIGSPGRIEAFVILMRMAGMLHQSPVSADLRVRRLEPTERLREMFRTRWFGTLDAMTIICPEAKTIREAFSNPEFERAMIGVWAREYMSGFRPMGDMQARRLFGDRNAGLLIAFSLMTSGQPNEFPPLYPVQVSISGLSRQFGVSRVHVRKMLRDAAAAGYIARQDENEGPVVILPPLKEATEGFFVNAFLATRAAAREAFAQMKAERIIGRRA